MTIGETPNSGTRLAVGALKLSMTPAGLEVRGYEYAWFGAADG